MPVPWDGLQADCKGKRCTVSQSTSVQYRIDAFELTDKFTADESASRFLGQTSFGATRQDIKSFLRTTNANSVIAPADNTLFKAWLDTQTVLPATRLRTYWRERTNQRVAVDSQAGATIQPCEKTSRWHRCVSERRPASMDLCACLCVVLSCGVGRCECSIVYVWNWRGFSTPYALASITAGVHACVCACPFECGVSMCLYVMSCPPVCRYSWTYLDKLKEIKVVSNSKLKLYQFYMDGVLRTESKFFLRGKDNAYAAWDGTAPATATYILCTVKEYVNGRLRLRIGRGLAVISVGGYE